MVGRKATSLDIAYLAGVSQATVSRALRDSALVSAQTRDKIKRIARELNYRVDRVASNLRTGSTRTLALLLFEEAAAHDAQINPFFLAMLGSITRASAARGYDLLVSFQQLSEDWHAYYKDGRRADGLILLGYGDYVTARPKLQRLADSGARFVLWGPRVDGQPGISVSCDNEEGGFRVTRHLLASGRRSIAFVGSNTECEPEFAARYRGYVRALRDSGVAVDAACQFDAGNSEACGARAVDRMLGQGAVVDALVCASDLIAIGALNRLRERAVAVPSDVAVTGFDDIAAATSCRPALTTMRQDTLRAGEMLVDVLLAQLGGESVESHLMEPQLIVRESCGAG